MSGDALLQFLLSASANPWAALATKATLTMTGALLVVAALRRAPASLRHVLAAAAFGALLLLPLAATWGPSHVVTVASSRPASRVETQAPAPAPRVVGTAPTLAEAGPRPTPRLPIGAIVGGLYGAGVVAVLASLLAGVARLYRLRDRSEASATGTRLANAIARREGAPTGIQVLTSRELAAPLTFGSARPVVLLPAAADAWDEDELARALRHEIEHVTRRDWAVQLGARVAFALYWAHPLAWVLWRRLRLEAERACDDAVIRSQGQPETYAGQLVALARRVGGHGHVPALSMAMRSDLGLRVEAILDAAAPRAPRTRLAVVAALAAAAFALATVAPVRLARAADRERIPSGPGPVKMSQLNRERHSEGHGVDQRRAVLDRMTQEHERAPIEVDDIEVDTDARLDLFTAIDVDVDANVDVDADADAESDVNVDVSAAVDDKVEADLDDDHDAEEDGDRDDSLDMRLMKAAERGSLTAMRGLIDAGAKPGAVLTGDGSPLIAAARGGHVGAIELLVEKGADVDRGVEGDGSPLIAAAQEGHVEAVRALIARGASIDKGVPGDGNALIAAAGAGHDEVVRFLLDSGAGIETVVPGDENALIKASESGADQVVKMLIDRGADVNARVKAIGPNGRVEYRTPLSMARRHGHEDIERILLKAGAKE